MTELLGVGAEEPPKRAVGEGSMAVKLIHQRLAEQRL